MGTFEKLGILVIVVIIVMILAVAIYQWGGDGADAPLAVEADGSVLTVRNIHDYEKKDDAGGQTAENGESGTEETSATWPGGVPKSYTVRRNDSLWVLVFRRWRLKDSFIQEIARANPGLDVKRLQPGRDIVIPDPTEFRRDSHQRSTPAPGDGRVYEVQIGDKLESIARTHLGSASRWHEIVDLNPGLRPERLRPGQKILLPIDR